MYTDNTMKKEKHSFYKSFQFFNKSHTKVKNRCRLTLPKFLANNIHFKTAKPKTLQIINQKKNYTYFLKSRHKIIPALKTMLRW